MKMLQDHVTNSSGDERPCNRCIKRNLGDHCMDGVRKKAKYLHDAPDGALMPGVGGHYPFMNGNRPTPLPSHDTQNVSMTAQGNLYTQASSATFYPPPPAPLPMPSGQDGRVYNNQQSPISPPYTQAHHNQALNVPSSMSQAQPTQMQQFGPLFDPSDPALFNFDISGLNFGNHYGALEFGMLGHMSSGAVDSSNDNGMMNAMNQGVMYGPQMSGAYVDQITSTAGMSYGQNGLPTGDWQEAPSRQGSMHVHTPSHTPATSLDHNGNRHDGINGPHAFAIGHGASSHSTASPASTDVSTFENDNPMTAATFFANASRNQAQRSPTISRQQQETRPPSTALQPVHSNGIRKRRDTKSIYQGIKKPYDYVQGWHRLFELCHTKFEAAGVEQARDYLKLYRPVLLSVHQEMNTDDLIHQEMGLQRNLMTLERHFEEVGTPFLICRRSGEIVGINKEFTILTGWKKEVLLGAEPNLNVNVGHSPRANTDTDGSTQTNTTPNLTAQPDSESGAKAVNVVELMDAKSALTYLQHFSELCWQDPHGNAKQRANMLRYQTQPEYDRIQDMKANASEHKHDLIKTEGGAVHQGESAMQRLGAKNGMVDCMIWWHIKRDIFEMPFLVCMSVSLLEEGGYV
jgi:hypothetical protein